MEFQNCSECIFGHLDTICSSNSLEIHHIKVSLAKFESDCYKLQQQTEVTTLRQHGEIDEKIKGSRALDYFKGNIQFKLVTRNDFEFTKLHSNPQKSKNIRVSKNESERWYESSWRPLKIEVKSLKFLPLCSEMDRLM